MIYVNTMTLLVVVMLSTSVWANRAQQRNSWNDTITSKQRQMEAQLRAYQADSEAQPNMATHFKNVQEAINQIKEDQSFANKLADAADQLNDEAAQNFVDRFLESLAVQVVLLAAATGKPEKEIAVSTVTMQWLLETSYKAALKQNEITELIRNLLSALPGQCK